MSFKRVLPVEFLRIRPGQQRSYEGRYFVQVLPTFGVEREPHHMQYEWQPGQ